MKKDILAAITADSKALLAAAKRLRPLSALERLARQAPARGSFAARFRAPGGRHIIAELKRASPSRGMIRESLDVRATAKELEAAGAAALSVLTEPNYFKMSLDALREAASAVELPILRKDFLYDPYQIYEARLAGASAVLLIAAMLEPAQLEELAHCALSLGMDVLGEAHNEAELDILLHSPVTLIGINARNLSDFSCSLDIPARLLGKIPRDRLPIAESSLRSREDLLRMEEAGAVGFLIGETLMRGSSPGEALKELL
ncbi:MAG: indole-3-glycerol phosphate synthase TrpC [Victivallaceae bacterium]|nr:indole-3-glycerol phosphate synthase TrpC [Victivallaceae bacterium]